MTDNLILGETTMACLVCGSPTKHYKMSIFGQIRHPLCQDHGHYVPYLRFASSGGQGQMGVYNPADPNSIPSGEEA